MAPVPTITPVLDEAEARPRSTSIEIELLFEQSVRLAGPARTRMQNRIIEKSLALAESIARKYRGRLADWRDLTQVASIGLIKAVRRFEPARGKDFLSFAVPTISGEVKRYLRDTGWAVRPPRRLQELAAAAQAAQRNLEQRLHRPPTATEIAAEIGSTPEEAGEALLCREGMYAVPWDRPERSDSPAEPAAEDAALERAEIRLMLGRAYRILSERERRILHLRFFEDRTQQEIADELGVTQVQVSRLLRGILERLRGELLGEDRVAA